MGSISAKQSQPLIETEQTTESNLNSKVYSNVPLSEPSTESATCELGTPTTPSSPQNSSTSSQPKVAELSSTKPGGTVGHAEWDECVKQSTLTIGSATITAIALGLMVPAAETLLLIGTGAGVLWSIKQCRILMRDGLLSPEESKALENKRRMEREERKRHRKMEKEAKQKAAAERKLLEKQKQKESKTGAPKGKISNECCTKLEKMLEEKGSRKEPKTANKTVKNEVCENVSHKNDTAFEGIAMIFGPKLAEGPRPITVQGNQSIDVIQTDESEKIEVVAKKLVPPDDETNKRKPERKTTVKQGDDMYSSVKIFAPFSRYLSETVILTCDTDECDCNRKEEECTCDSQQQSYGEPQQYTLGADADEDAMKNEPDNLVVHPINSHPNEEDEHKRNKGNEVSWQSSSPKNNPIFMNDAVKKVNIEETTGSTDYEENAEVIMSPPFNNIDSSSNDTMELIVEHNEDTDIRIEETPDGSAVELMRSDTDNEQIDQLTETGVIFAETFKSESWPFSFSLPSPDKFSKKKNNSFKWPPLPSSIIVKPTKEPTCTCSSSSGNPTEKEQKHSTRYSFEADCNCP